MCISPTTKLTCPVLPGRGNRFYQKPRPAAPGQVERLVRPRFFSQVAIEFHRLSFKQVEIKSPRLHRAETIRKLDSRVVRLESIVEAGCRTFVVHARIAILAGLSPKQNRTVPPINYERVYRLKRDFPELEIVLNGGVTNADQVDEILERVLNVTIEAEKPQ